MNLEEIPEVMREVFSDCAADAHRTEGLALTGRNVGELFGSTLAMVAAVAKAVELLAEERAA